jgi:hypothetical protein
VFPAIIVSGALSERVPLKAVFGPPAVSVVRSVVVPEAPEVLGVTVIELDIK